MNVHIDAETTAVIIYIWAYLVMARLLVPYAIKDGWKGILFVFVVTAFWPLAIFAKGKPIDG